MEVFISQGVQAIWWPDMDKLGRTRRDVHITLDEDVIRELDELGVVRSRFINSLLRWALFEEAPTRIVKLILESKMVGPPGFEPGSRAPEAVKAEIRLNEFWSRYREAFDKWLSVRVSDETRRSYMNALERFFKTYTITSYSDLEDALVEENYKRNLAKGLRNFIKFLKGRGEISKEAYEDLKGIIKLKKVRPRRTFLTTEEIREAYKHFEDNSVFSTIFKLLVFSGLRLRHAVYLLNTYDRNKLILGETYAKYPLFEASRGNKPVFYAYMPRDFALSLDRIIIDYDYVKNRLRYKRVNASNIRKWFFNYLMDLGVPLQVIKFIAGQTPSGVAEEYYLKLERHADRWYSRVVDELKKVLEGGGDGS